MHESANFLPTAFVMALLFTLGGPCPQSGFLVDDVSILNPTLKQVAVSNVINGNIENLTGQAFRNALLRVTLRRNGAVVDTPSTVLQNLPAGTARPFEIVASAGVENFDQVQPGDFSMESPPGTVIDSNSFQVADIVLDTRNTATLTATVENMRERLVESATITGRLFDKDGVEIANNSTVVTDVPPGSAEDVTISVDFSGELDTFKIVVSNVRFRVS